MAAKFDLRAAGRGGQVLVLFALAAPLIFAFLGLALDLGVIMLEDERIQAAADAGALAGAFEVKRDNDSLVYDAVYEDARRNGYDVNDAEVSVAIETGASLGAEYVDVTVAREVDTYFLRMFGHASSTVSARARAQFGGYPAPCILALNPTAPNALRIDDQVQIDIDCGMMSNSCVSNGLLVRDQSNVQALWVGVCGQSVVDQSWVNPTPDEDLAPVPDPFDYLQTPPEANNPCDFTGYSIRDRRVTLSPGVYCGGISIEDQSNATFLPGTYVIRGGGLFVKDAVAQGDGVFFFNTCASGPCMPGDNSIGRMRLIDQSRSEFSAPTSGPYEGFVMFNDPNAPSSNGPHLLGDQSTFTPRGRLYFPTVHLVMNDQTGADSWVGIVADTITIGDQATVHRYGLGGTEMTLSRKVSLVY